MEYFDVVDEEDKVVGQASRSECHSNPELIHRSVQFFIFDEEGRVLVNQRSAGKEFFQSQWSIVLGGHVPAGESYLDAVRREAWEEAKVKSTPFEMGYFKKRIPQEKENVKVYGFNTDGRVDLLADEIRCGEFMDVNALDEITDTRDFIPETKQLRRILADYLKTNPE